MKSCSDSKRASPAAAAPRTPETARMSPGRAPLRSSAGPGIEPVKAAVIDSSLPELRSPPASAHWSAPSSLTAAEKPSAIPSTHATGVSGGSVREMTAAVATAPMALTSDRFCAADFHPTSYPLLWYPLRQLRRKSRSWTRVSMVTTKRPPGASIMAASSPGPSSMLAPRRRGRIRLRTPASPSPATVCS
ncbi:hypothetical protein FM101_09270 [Arthrobacter rhombi]|uniref:Uncharacterized protein n=1 Tax=Arthrobacter rhombi TaxID=71253 RepID=A0A1R4GB94_9MICC|nr:hypothetical protein FM101_09270 [Arthrobacter rhombi]